MNGQHSGDGLLNWRQIAAVMFAVGAVAASGPGIASAAPDGEAEPSTSVDADSDGTSTSDEDTAEEHTAEDTAEDTSADDAPVGAGDTDAAEEEPGTAEETVTDAVDTDAAEVPDDAEDAEPAATSKGRRSQTDQQADSETDSETNADPGSEPDTDTDTDTGDTAPDEQTEVTSAEPSPAQDSATMSLAVVPTADEPEAVPASRPVTTKTIISDVLTWVGLGQGSDDLPILALPVPKLVEMMWLAVRQTQYTWNNQRPVAQPTLSGQDVDGVVTGDLNVTDFDDATLTYAVVTPARFGTVVVDPNGAFTYTPRPGVAVTTDTFTITVDDMAGNQPHLHGIAGLLGQTGPTTATVTVNVTPTAITDTAVSHPGAVTVQMDAGGRISVIGGAFTDTKVFDKAGAAAVLNAFAPILDAETGFATTDSITVHRVGGSGATEEFYRLRQTVDGIEVIGSDVILVTDGNGTVTGLFNYHDSRIADVDTTPDLAGGATVAALAAAHLFTSTGARPSRAVTRLLTTDVGDPELVILAVGDDEAPSLVWRVELPVATYYIRANGEHAGEVVSGTANTQHATTVARDLLGVDREINVEPSKWWYFFDSEGLVDTIRNIETYATGYTLFGFGIPYLPGDISTRSLLFGWSAGGVSAHANMAQVYDYYAAVLGRESYDGKGATVVSSVGYNPRNELIAYFFGHSNAHWDYGTQQFLFGDAGGYEGALDIVGHEFTHGVVSYVVGDADGGAVLDSGEPGALNEAYADILGNLIEGKTGEGRWLVGEDTSGGPIRSMAVPTAVGADYRDDYANRYTGTGDDGGEHWNSTIFSHAAYLMMTDPDTAAVSDDTWAKVFYSSLGRLDDGAMFTDGRAAVLGAAADLKLTLAQRQAIAAAFDEVGITGSPVITGQEALDLIAL